MKINNDLLKTSHVMFVPTIDSQLQALTSIANLALSLGYITNSQDLVTAFCKREQESSTGFEDGIAIPHARLQSIKKPAILILCNSNGVDWKAIDGQLTNIIIALIIPEREAEHLHLDILSTLATKLVNPQFRQKLKLATTAEEIILLINEETINNSAKAVTTKTLLSPIKKIVGVSACTTGVVHTYMCKELLETVGKELGYQVHIECQGQKGPEYVLSTQEINEADVVILATDIAIDLERFLGKKIYNCSTKSVVTNAKQVITTSLSKAQKYSKTNNNSDFILDAAKNRPAILKHLLSGVSYMIPFVVFAGLIFAIVNGVAKGTFGTGFEFKTSWEAQLAWLKTSPPGVNMTVIGGTTLMHVLMIINNIASIGFTLMIPIMGAYIAYSIAGRPAIAPAMIITFLLVSPGSGMWFDWGIFNLSANSKIDAHQPFTGNANVSWTLFGALYGGLTAGYLVRWVNSWKVAKWLLPIMPIIIIPVFCTAIIAIPTAFFLAAPFGYVMGALDYGLSWMGIHPSIGFLVGLLLGAMVGFDMGGPINKTAVLVATSLMVQDDGRLMGPVAAAIPIAPLGCALTATIFSRKLFNKQEQSLGWNAWLLGFMGISETAIPFAVKDTWRVIVANIIGSAVAGALAFIFGVLGHVGAWGSFIIALFGGVTDTAGSYVGILWYIIAIIVGMVVQALIYSSLLLQKQGSYQAVMIKILHKIGIKTKSKINSSTKTNY